MNKAILRKIRKIRKAYPSQQFKKLTTKVSTSTNNIRYWYEGIITFETVKLSKLAYYNNQLVRVKRHLKKDNSSIIEFHTVTNTVIQGVMDSELTFVIPEVNGHEITPPNYSYIAENQIQPLSIITYRLRNSKASIRGINRLNKIKAPKGLFSIPKPGFNILLGYCEDIN